MRMLFLLFTILKCGWMLFEPQCLGLKFYKGGSVAEWLACWTQAQKGPGSNRDAVG